MMVAIAVCFCMWCGEYTRKGFMICIHSLYCGYCCQKVCWRCARVTAKRWCDAMINKYRETQGSVGDLTIGLQFMNIDDRCSFVCKNCIYIKVYLSKQEGWKHLALDLVWLFASII